MPKSRARVALHGAGLRQFARRLTSFASSDSTIARRVRWTIAGPIAYPAGPVVDALILGSFGAFVATDWHVLPVLSAFGATLIALAIPRWFAGINAAKISDTALPLARYKRWQQPLRLFDFVWPAQFLTWLLWPFITIKKHCGADGELLTATLDKTRLGRVAITLTSRRKDGRRQLNRLGRITRTISERLWNGAGQLNMFGRTLIACILFLPPYWACRQTAVIDLAEGHFSNLVGSVLQQYRAVWWLLVLLQIFGTMAVQAIPPKYRKAQFMGSSIVGIGVSAIIALAVVFHFHA